MSVRFGIRLWNASDMRVRCEMCIYAFVPPHLEARVVVLEIRVSVVLAVRTVGAIHQLASRTLHYDARSLTDEWCRFLQKKGSEPAGERS